MVSLLAFHLSLDLLTDMMTTPAPNKLEEIVKILGVDTGFEAE